MNDYYYKNLIVPFIKKKDVKNDWYIINAENAVIGRLAAFISIFLNILSSMSTSLCIHFLSVTTAILLKCEIPKSNKNLKTLV